MNPQKDIPWSLWVEAGFIRVRVQGLVYTIIRQESNTTIL